MIYILDAYNVIHKIPSLETMLDKSLRAARDALVAFCGKFASGRGDILKIILVFDGKSQFRDLPQAHPPKIDLIFSETNEDADERIITLLEQLSKKTNACVVSDDNFVINQVRAYGALVMPVCQFEQLVNSRNKKKKNRKMPFDNSSLPPEIARAITEAYKKELGIT